MPYIVAWSVIEKIKPKKNALFVLPPIIHDIYEIKTRKIDAVSRYNALLKTDVIGVMWGEIKEITIQK